MKCPISVLLVLGLALSTQAVSLREEKLVYAEDLPSGDLITPEAIEKAKDYVKQNMAIFGAEANTTLAMLDEIEGGRYRRDATSGSVYCCKITGATQQVPRDVTRVRTVTKIINAGGSISCGWLGTSRCSSNRQISLVVQQYYTETNWVAIPAPEWTNGCPDRHITCCEDYSLFKDRCWSMEDVAAWFVYQGNFPHYNILGSILGIDFAPIPIGATLSVVGPPPPPRG